MSVQTFRPALAALAIAPLFLASSPATAGPDACTPLGPNAVLCSGNQSAGVAPGSTSVVGGAPAILQSPPYNTIDVRALTGAITPAAAQAGIRLQNDAGANVTVNAGVATGHIEIRTSGNAAGGIVVRGYGTPTPTQTFFGWTIPTGPGGSGGNVTVDGFATITTDGNEAPGISARSRAGGYSDAVVASLQTLLGTNQSGTFRLGTVQGDAANIGKAVTGTAGGTFTLSNVFGIVPVYTYDLKGMALAALQPGEHLDTSVNYTVMSGAGHAPSNAVLTLRVKRLADGTLSAQSSTYFDVYGRAFESAAQTVVDTDTARAGVVALQPDFDGYMTRLLADSAVGGAGGAVTVRAHGAIETRRDASLGQGSYGILAQSKGGTGLAGSGGVFSGDTGNAGSAGGAVLVENAATIHTHGEGAHGIVASSSGGDGGRGGGASFAGNGGAGGTGAKGGEVVIENTGTITTERANAIGIFAQSIGGRGGEGGGGGWLGGGGGGGGGATVNDRVYVSSAGAITTHGEDSHGILAQNIGGFGGSGGGAGGIVALGSTGGNAGAGGAVTIANSGHVETTGRSANALMAQSIGGGGGSAGASGGLVAIGGDGTAGGNGGLATVDNSGELVASGLGARGIVAQSIGGGGGHGGDSGGLVAIGGDGATTSDGGKVVVTNSGRITASSNAILAESVGGGGGTGGSSGGWFGVGGSGGGGGAGGEVSVTNRGDLATSGRNATALFAQSVGGGGGHGGNVVAVGAFGSVAIGGAGGPGGNAKAVVVKSTAGAIETDGVQSHGIQAQSVGGGGGNGGFAAAVAVGKGIAASLAVGRTGGGGGDGAAVQLESASSITTHEDDAYGIFAQSVGGGGGAGGFAVAASAAVNGVAASFAIGGGGGAAGDGNKVEVGKEAAITGTITTEGDNAHGIVAQSVGGGGGRGGLSVAGNISVGSGAGGGLSLSIGGGGGAGGAGNAVTLHSAATITTAGEKAYGIKAQSVGGGGGDGGMAIAGAIGGPGTMKVNVAVGGSGGAGSWGGSVDVNVTGGSIATEGKDAHGVFAQSVGGGGGDGGLAISGTLGLGGKNVNLGISAGGVGGTGSIGGRVDVSNAAGIETEGDAAFGIFAQSVGGGGGLGGASFSGNGTLNAGQEGYNVNIGIAFGGAGGAGNRGGEVEVVNAGSITTRGTAAHGIFAESVGGGGGQGGSARTMSINFAAVDVSTLGKYASFNFSMGGKGGSGGDGNAVKVTNSGSIDTFGPDSHGIHAQSVGGGGGTGGEGAHGFFGVPAIVLDRTPLYQQVSVSMGGSAGAAGDGKAVTVLQQGRITTHETGSYGIYAQSVGGGGGTGGAGAIGFTGTVGIGGSGGASGDAGRVEVTANGTIDILGGAGAGVFAQSVGGGGGNAGNIDRGLGLNIGWGAGIVRNAGNGGNGGEVVVNGSGVIHTRGDASNGVFAQSVGGGGGLAGDRHGWGWSGSAGGNGSGGGVTVDWTGRIVTEGVNAHGIYAQSAGGEAVKVVVYDQEGNPTTTTLTPRQNLAGNVNVTVRGDVIAGGARSHAVYAESKGAQGNGDIVVRILERGTVQGGSGADAAGISIAGGKANRIENTGTIGSTDGIRGAAIVGGSGNESVVNAGTVTGTVLLGAGSNAFLNQPGATFAAGPVVELGNGNTLTNHGTLAPGGSRSTGATALAGNLVQPGGTLAVDLDRRLAVADRVDATGTAQVGGSVALTELNRGAARPGREQYTVLHASGGVQDAGVALTAPRSMINSYALSMPGANDVVVTVNTDFAPRGLNHNQTAVGRYLNAVQLAGSAPVFAPVVEALLDIPHLDGLKNAYDQLNPATYANQTVTATTSSMRFNDALLSCRVRDGEYRFVAEGQCYWLRALGRQTTRDRTAETGGFDENAGEVAAGAQMPLNAHWFIGAGMGQEWSSLTGDPSVKSTGERTQIGVMLKAVYNGATAAFGITTGYGSYDSRRSLDLVLPGATATSRQSVSFAGAHMRLGYAFEQRSWYVRPLLDLGATWVELDGFQESGGGPVGLNVQGQSETYGTIQPAVEIGGEIALDNGVLVRPYTTLGMTRIFAGDNPGITAQFQGAPVGVAPFTVTGEMDRTFADVAVGVDLLAKDGKDLRLVYVGQFASDTRTNAIAVKLSIPF